MRCIKRLAASGRSIVCTIHQPSTLIFYAFGALLLLRRGGQTVYFGDLSEHSCHLVSYFETCHLPGVIPKAVNSNPATWVIGASTSPTTLIVIDFHACYTQSSMCVANETRLRLLFQDGEVNVKDPTEAAIISTSGPLDIEFSAIGYAELPQRCTSNRRMLLSSR